MANRSHNWRCDRLRHSFLPPHSSSKYLISLPAYPSSCGIPNAMRDTPPAGYTPRSTARYGSGVAVARSVTWSGRNRSLEGSGEYTQDRKSTRLNSSHLVISYAVFCLKKKKKKTTNYVRYSEQENL